MPKPEPTYTVDQITRVKRWWCWDCGTPANPYRVHDDVWKAAWPEGAPHRRRLTDLATRLFPNAHRRDPTTNKVVISICLCFLCLERRLGRELQITDFPTVSKAGVPAYANYGVFIGYRMGTGAKARKLAKIAEETGDKKDEGG
jgi:hypothetical protein